MTMTGDTPLRVYLENGGAQIEANLLGAVALSAGLYTYPGLERVPTTASLHNPEPFSIPSHDAGVVPGAPSALFDSAYVELVPRLPLGISWYILALSNISPQVRVRPWAASPPPIGAYAVRFHTGSRPTVKRVAFCSKGSESAKVLFDLSEVVAAFDGTSPNSFATAQQSSSNVHCRPIQFAPMSTRLLELSCDGGVGEGEWAVSLLPGLTSASGAALATFGGATTLDKAITSSQRRDSGDGCTEWVPD